MNFEQAFSEQNILRSLCRLRVAAAKKRHDAHFLRNLSTAAKSPTPEEIDGYFPPRRAWLRLPREARRGLAPAQLAEMELFRTTQVLRRDPRHRGSDWAQRLGELMHRVRQSVLGDRPYHMETPRILPLLKERRPGGAVYRPLTIYGLEGRLVSGLCAMYLRRAFDPDFLPCSFAFRAKGPDGSVPQYHDAVRELVRYRTEVPEDLWVAEQDIRGFYDCVHHDVARRAFSTAIERAAARGVVIDPRAIAIFEAYLSSYSFPTVARPEGMRWLAERGRKGVIRWPEDELRSFWPEPEKERIGVPQGGAISCLIANLILDEADRAVLADAPAGERRLLYLRYVDDMICMHPDRAVCEAALARYARTLAELRLPVHPAKAVSYGRDFWTEAKSKSPYRWTGAEGGVPWVSFVGYQVRHDGLLRVRRASIEKELKKQVAVAGTVMRLVRMALRDKKRQRIRVAKRQVLHRLRMRMSAMSVGRRTLSTPAGTEAAQCWCAGFRLLHVFPFVGSQLGLLDRGRERQIARVRRALARLPADSKSGAGGKGRRPRRRELRYSGFPFSYRGCFARRPAVAPA